MLAPAHPDQAERLKTLRRYDILDTMREEGFDEIVELASQICEVPISLISLVDEDRQWFKAKTGLSERETDLERSVCSHAILDDGFTEIPDTRDDPRTRDNPLNTSDIKMRFYAGAPLVAPNGLPLGTLCVLDSKPRHLTDLQRNALDVLSRQVMKQLELRLALHNRDLLLHEADHRVKNSLQTLGSIVRLYGRNLTDPQAIDAFEAVRRRIEAIGALHAELQDSSDLNRVNAATFMRRIVDLLQSAAPPNIQISVEASDVTLSHGITSALGVIVSEFVSNSIKHGFPDGRDGHVAVSLREAGTWLRLVCRDDGIGARDQDKETADSANLGSSLVAAAASQLNGKLETELAARGSELTLLFNTPDA